MPSIAAPTIQPMTSLGRPAGSSGAAHLEADPVERRFPPVVVRRRPGTSIIIVEAGDRAFDAEKRWADVTNRFSEEDTRLRSMFGLSGTGRSRGLSSSGTVAHGVHRDRPNDPVEYRARFTSHLASVIDSTRIDLPRRRA